MKAPTVFTILFAYLFASGVAFSPVSKGKTIAFKTIGEGTSRPLHQGILYMASEEEGKSDRVASGSFYDDEYDSAPVKEGISDSMRQRLMAEASTGLDSNAKQNNVLLYIILAVAALVVVGGGGILY